MVGMPHGFHDLDDQVDLAVELLRGLVPPALVFCVFGGPEGGRIQVEGDGDVGGLLLADHGQQHGGETVDGVGVLAGVGGEVLHRQGVKGPEGHRVPIDDQQPLRPLCWYWCF